MGGGGLTGERERGRGRHAEIFALINDSSYMLKKIIKTHTTRLGVVDIIKPTFLRNAVATNRQRRVIASLTLKVEPFSNLPFWDLVFQSIREKFFYFNSVVLRVCDNCKPHQRKLQGPKQRCKKQKTKNKTKQNKTKQNSVVLRVCDNCKPHQRKLQGPKQRCKKQKTKNKTKQNKTKQNKTKQNKTKQNKTKQNKNKQTNKPETFKNISTSDKVCQHLIVNQEKFITSPFWEPILQ